MNTHKTIIIAAVALLSVGLISCKGHRADGTPNGETVEVVLQPTLEAADTAAGIVGDTADTTLPQEVEATTETLPEGSGQGI